MQCSIWAEVLRCDGRVLLETSWLLRPVWDALPYGCGCGVAVGDCDVPVPAPATDKPGQNRPRRQPPTRRRPDDRIMRSRTPSTPIWPLDNHASRLPVDRSISARTRSARCSRLLTRQASSWTRSSLPVLLDQTTLATWVITGRCTWADLACPGPTPRYPGDITLRRPRRSRHV
jgi:hypothetical protein